jgi:DNA-binding MarR family transcriptional regulator
MNRNLLRQFGHSLDEYDVLHQVHEHDGPIRMGELAEQLLVANSSCTRLVGKLVRSGHLVRRPGDIDRREVFVAPTAAGRKLHRRMATRHTRDIERLVGATLTAEAARALDTILPAAK